MRTYLFTAAAALAASCAAPQNASAQQAQTPPPCQEDVYHHFDFWLGDWEVFGRDAEGKLVKGGDNKISSQENGCLILEEWTDVRGGTGQSYNFYDPGMKKWRQVWVSAFGAIDYAGGLNENGEMVLEGEIAYRNGTTAPFTGTWTLNEDSTVTQHFRQYNTETDEWTDWFIGTYKRKETAED